MKKALILFCLALALALAACGGSAEPAPAPAEEPAAATTEEAATAETSTEEPAAAEETAPAEAEAPAPADTSVSEADIDGCHVVVTGSQVAKDYNGNPIIVVSYDFTNNTDKNQTPIWAFFGKAFQDGVELDIAFVTDDSVYDPGIEQKEIQPGVTLTGCQKAYVLTGTSPVEFCGGDMMNQDKIKMTFDIAQ